MKRCSRCILPEVFSNITYDQNGICSVCHAWDKKYKNTPKNSEDKFVELLDYAKKTTGNSKYDLVIAFSGGKDSCYVVHLLKKYNTKPLLVNFNNFFQSDLAKDIISKILKKTKLDLVTYTPNKDNFLQVMRKSFMKTGNFCTACNLGIYSCCQKIAAKNDIRVALFGGGGRLESNLISEHPELDFYKYVRGMLQDDPSIDWTDFIVDEDLCRKIRFAFIGDYTNWNHKTIIETLQKEFNIKFPEHGASYIHADCNLVPIKNYINMRKNHLSINENTLASLIRDGQITRAEALSVIEDEFKSAETDPEYLATFLSMIGISRDDLEKALKYKAAYRPPWYHGETGVKADKDK
jgi:hypothetical protein